MQWCVILLWLCGCCYVSYFFFFSSRRRHTRSCLVSWARRCVQETGPQPHGSQPGVLLQAQAIYALEDYAQRFAGDCGPDLFQVFLQGDDFAAGLLDARVAAIDLQGWPKAGEDGIGTHYALGSKAGQPGVNAPRKLRQHIAPVAHIVFPDGAVRVLAGATYKVN
eukprot:TRINITY_DN26555_c0_g1_i1.p3 TRINITY_DN26555_c0_g1~~TRINITY_DN26555_c0_g1_i1.p3  ORF type:complete len:165 (-),score=9.16 TRINITY_DN26555_c0_g1_i1:162-656(-)